ncbi:MAG: hypothetical protein U1F27_00030 [Turneriella sp.]
MQQIEVQTGRLKNDITPSADFGVAFYRANGFRIGGFTSPTAQGLLASYKDLKGILQLELGQRENSLEQGFLISNGAYLPWTRNFAYAEPAGLRLALGPKILSADAAYYQQSQNNLLLSRVTFSPVTWFSLRAGAAMAEVQQQTPALPVASLTFGKAAGMDGKIYAGLEMAGKGNYLTFVQFSDDLTIRALAFRRSETNALASGIFDNDQGLAIQYISDGWFAQFFSAGGEFGMLRYAGDYLTAVSVYEQKTQLAGFSLRNSPKGLHVRSGITFAADTSMQTLAGLGYDDFIFLGGGHYQTKADQPLEPIIFPSEWYSSVLLQSTSMRIKDTGFKMLALVNTGVVNGFVALTYAEDFRRREQFGFFMRLSGHVEF